MTERLGTLIVSDFRPRVGNASELRRNLESRLCESYLGLLTSIESALGIDHGHLGVLAPSVSERPLASRVYATHWRLGTALDSSAKDHIMPALNELARGRHDLLDLRVATYSGDYVDGAADEYLAGKEGQRINRPADATDGARPPDLGGLADDRLSELNPHVRETTNLIATLDAAMSDEVVQYARELRLVDSKVIGGMSSVRFFGTIFLRQPPLGASDDGTKAHLLSGLVHETSHHHLHAVMAGDPLVLNRAERFDSPLRRDKRPMLGIYHATFVLARLAYMFGRWSDLQPGNQEVEEQLVDARGRLAKGLQTVREHGELTPLGAEFLETMSSEAAEK